MRLEWIVILILIGAFGVQTYRLADARNEVLTVQRDAAKQRADSAEKAVSEWRAEWDRQQKADADQQAKDRTTDAATASAITALGVRYEQLAKRLAPTGQCTLSKEWVEQFNEAR